MPATFSFFAFPDIFYIMPGDFLNNQQPFSGLNDDDLDRNTTNDFMDRNLNDDPEIAPHGNDQERNSVHDVLNLEDELPNDEVPNHSPFQLGNTFSSFSEFESAKEKYEKEHFAVLVKSKSDKWPEGHKYREKLLYQYVIYVCKKGEQRHVSQAKGVRPNVRSGKLGCSFKLKLASKQGVLVVKEFSPQHTNHTLSQDRFLHLPEQLRLTKDELREAELVLQTGGNKKKLQAHLMAQRGGKPVILKQLHNLGTKLRKTNCSNETDLEKLVEEMKKIPEAVVKIAYEETTKDLIGVFFQDERMKSVFSKFPEVVIFDATYKLNSSKLPLFILLAIDGNGESEIVAVFIVKSESKLCVGTMLKYFKECNSDWDKIQVMIGDKDFADRIVFKDNFPSARLSICLFHALRTFKREIAEKVPNLDRTRREKILEIFTNLAYAQSREAYNVHFSELISLNIQELSSYYIDNWHSIQDEWVLFAQNETLCFMNRTTNRLESLNQKLKTVITRYSSLPNFFKDLLISISSSSVERDHRAIEMCEKKAVIRGNIDPVEVQIRKLLTEFAAGHVVKQYKRAANVNFLTVTDNSAVLQNDFKTVTTMEDSCTCGFFLSMGLPCCHIFKFRLLKDLPVFEDKLCLLRWTRSYFLSSHPAFLKCNSNPTETQNILIQPKSEFEKYREAFTVMKDISAALSTMSHDRYDYYLEKIKQFRDLVHLDKAVVFMEDDGPHPTTSPTNELEQNTGAIRTTQEVRPTCDQATTQLEQVIQASGSTEGTSCQTTASSQAGVSGANIELSMIKIPKPLKKVGRAKGFGQTVIGLKKGQKRKKTVSSDIFINKPEHEKVRIILKFFVDDDVVERCMDPENPDLIHENEVEILPNIVPFQRLRDERVNLETVKKYFDSDAFKIVKMLKREIIKKGWHCCDCFSKLQESSIQCDKCLNWYNWSCQNLTTAPPSDYWFCPQCN